MSSPVPSTSSERVESLHPDLQQYLQHESGYGDLLRHPLAYCVRHRDAMNATMNSLYRHKLVALAEARARQDWDLFIYLHERPYRLNALLDIRHALHGREYWTTLRELWIGSENIWENLKSWKGLWSSHEPEQNFVMNNDERLRFAELPSRFTIWRGVRYRSASRSMSWTLDRSTAEWFAKRRLTGRRVRLLECEIEKTEVIALIDGRDESEIVVHPSFLARMVIAEHRLD